MPEEEAEKLEEVPLTGIKSTDDSNILNVTPVSSRGQAGLVAWSVLCHSRVRGNPVKPIKNLFF
ncbi:hypothetical protein [Rickettsia asembonensis]|uniref:hypothetical protein n=1 Tax=Rickettsia asembonensis TaxID=1068590 RepID=UPI0011BAD026|nr:hypothetical protein [Rickettsia asembonensis]